MMFLVLSCIWLQGCSSCPSQDQPLPLADTLPAASTPATPHEHEVTALLAVLDERSREMVVLRYGLEGDRA